MTSALLPPEWRVLLLACAVPPSDTRRRLRQELDAATLDWNRVVTCAREHDLGPRAYEGLRSHGVLDAVAPPARATLQEHYFATAIRNTVLLRELARLLQLLRSQGTPVILLKGAALAATVARNVALRPMRDIDLLVPEADVPAVHQLFESAGYSLDPDYRARYEWYRSSHYHLAFHTESSAGPRLTCEVHWQIERASRPFTIDTDGLWARSAPVGVGHAAARVLSPEDVLLHLCLHACKHRLAGGFRAFCDIADVIGGFEGRLDWTQVHARADEWRIAEFVYVPLWLAQELLGAPVPRWFMHACRPDAVDEPLLAAAAAEAMTDRVGSALFADFLALSHGGSVAQRARALKAVFAPETVASRYGISPGSKQLYWYYARRLKDVAVAYGPRLWEFSRRPHQAAAQSAAQTRLAEWLAPFSDNQLV